MELMKYEGLPIGSAAPDFSLPAVDGKTYSLGSFKDKPILVVAFWCNHCPYVQAWEDRTIAVQKDFASKGVQFVAINANDQESYPEDDFAHMVERSKRKGYNFPYLHDESQKSAEAYGAVCTPDFFVFDAGRKLRYRGKLDDSKDPPDSGGHSGIRFEFDHEFLNVPQGSSQLVDNRDRGALRSAGEGIQVDADHRFLHADEGLRTVPVFQGDEYHIRTEDSFTVREGAFRIEAGDPGVGTKPEDAFGPGALEQMDDFPNAVLRSMKQVDFDPGGNRLRQADDVSSVECRNVAVHGDHRAVRGEQVGRGGALGHQRGSTRPLSHEIVPCLAAAVGDESLRDDDSRFPRPH